MSDSDFQSPHVPWPRSRSWPDQANSGIATTNSETSAIHSLIGIETDDLGPTFVVELLELRLTLATRPVIDQAKGMLMMHDKIDADMALELLDHWAAQSQVSVRRAARTVVSLMSTDPPPSIYDSRIVGIVRSHMCGTVGS